MNDKDIFKDNYLDQCRKLSLTARSAIALVVFKGFCEKNNISGQALDDFLDYMWEWPVIDGADQFTPWEDSKPSLVNFGLGDEESTVISDLLKNTSIKDYQFRSIVAGVVEILWGSFWGASENDLSLQALKAVLNLTNTSNLPSLTPFKFSKFKDDSGWGKSEISKSDRDFWRSCN